MGHPQPSKKTLWQWLLPQNFPRHWSLWNLFRRILLILHTILQNTHLLSATGLSTLQNLIQSGREGLLVGVGVVNHTRLYQLEMYADTKLYPIVQSALEHKCHLPNKQWLLCTKQSSAHFWAWAAKIFWCDTMVDCFSPNPPLFTTRRAEHFCPFQARTSSLKIASCYIPILSYCSPQHQ